MLVDQSWWGWPHYWLAVHHRPCTWALIICWIQTSCSGVKAGGAWVPAVADRPPRVGPVVPLFPAVAAPRPPLRGRPRVAVVAGPFAIRLGVACLRVGGIVGRLNDGLMRQLERWIDRTLVAQPLGPLSRSDYTRHDAAY